MHATVAICTWNRAALLADTLASIERMRVPAGTAWELLVVDNASTDDTPAVLARFRDRLPLRSVVETQQGCSHARNRAMDEATGALLVWTDDDVQVEPGWFAAYLDAAARHPDAAFFGGPVDPLFAAPPPPWFEANLDVFAAALALRGDPPGGGEFVKTEGGFEYSRELVAFIRKTGGFSIATAGFPEGHIACKAGKYQDWEYLADKIQAGADFVITQLFFDNADFYEFHDHLVGKLGVTVPIIPGIMPILSAGQTKRFVALCGAQLPAPFLRRLDELGDDDAAVTAYGIEYATEQCASLLEYGVPGLHFYTLNKAHSTVPIARNLGLAS